MRTIDLALLALSASSVMSACADNFLATQFWITVEAAPVTATTAADFKYCSLADGDTLCCTKETVLGFQAKADAYIDALEALAGDRDQYILDRRGDVLEVRESLSKLAEAIASATASGNAATIAAVAALASTFGDYAEAFATNFDTLKGDFIKYQKARVTCMEKIVETQVSAWCLACSDDFATTNGVVTTAGSLGVDYDATVGTALAAACFDYITYSAGQSAIISLYATRDVLSSLASAVEKLANGDESGASTDLATANTALDKATLPTDANEKPVDVPTLCTGTSCSWLTDSAFLEGVLQNQTIIQGGSLSSVPTLPSARRLEGGRNLAGTWTPVASGVTIAFTENPGDVDNDQNSAVRNGIVACAVAALALVL